MRIFSKKMKQIKCIFFFLNLFYSLVLSANEQTFKIKGHTLLLNKITGYQIMRGYLGRDIVLLGPDRAEKRNTIFLEVAESKRVNLNEEKESLADFENLKKEWINERGGKLHKLKLNSRDLKIEKDYLYNYLSYSLDKKNFYEGDIFLKCSPKTSLNLSFLVLKKNFDKFKPQLEDFIKGISCP